MQQKNLEKYVSPMLTYYMAICLDAMLTPIYVLNPKLLRDWLLLLPWEKFTSVFSRPYLSNDQIYGTICRLSICLSIDLIQMYCG